LYTHAYEGEGKPLSYEANSEMSSLITNGQSLQNQIKVIGNKIMKFCVFLSVVVLSFGYAIIVLPLVKYFTKQFKSILKI
ncbi:MAG: hypothetical protein ACFNJI_08905, partial [Leptotrichia hongkongensis]